jgi:hypothetical protein
MNSPTTKLDDVREQVRRTWNDDARGWIGAPSDIVGALEDDGFCECKHLIATTRRDGRSASGVWQGGQSAYGIHGIGGVGSSRAAFHG